MYASSSASLTGDLTAVVAGRLSKRPSNAIAVEAPESSADAVTAPSCIIASASSKFVIPTLYPGWLPSTATSRIFPSAR